MPRKKRRRTESIKISSCSKFFSEVERFAEALEKKEVVEFLEIMHLLKTGTKPSMPFDLNDAKNLISKMQIKFAYMKNGNVYFPVSDLTMYKNCPGLLASIVIYLVLITVVYCFKNVTSNMHQLKLTIKKSRIIFLIKEVDKWSFV
jgi:hypothetical protein